MSVFYNLTFKNTRVSYKMFNIKKITITRMARFKLTLLAFILAFTGTSQSFNKVYEKAVDRPLISLIDGEEVSYYLSNSGNYLVINSPERYQIISGNDGEELASGSHMEKSGSVSFASAVIGGSAGGSLIDGEALKESSGFYAFEKQNVVVFLDWTLDKNVIKAFDSETGEKLWETSGYRFTPGSDKQVASLLATIAVSNAVRSAIPASGMTSSGVYYSVDMNYLPTSYGSQHAKAFITPLEGTGSFLLKAGDELVCLNIRSGQEKWTYSDYDINIAEAHMVPGSDLVGLVNFNPSFFAKSENLVIFLDTKTGEEVQRIEHLSNYVKDRTYIRGKTLILDYYGVEMFDIETGARLTLSIDEKVVKTNNTMMSLLGSQGGEKNQTSIALPSVIGNKAVYTATSKMGRRTYAMTAGGRNVKVHAYDLETGEEIWTSKELEKGAHPVDLAGRQVIMQEPEGFRKNIFYGLNTETGEKSSPTDKIKYYLLRNNAGHKVVDKTIVISGKKGLYLYDLTSWKEKDEVELKKKEIGKMQAMDVNNAGMFIVGDDGIGFYDEQGNFEEALEIKKLEGSVWSDEIFIAFTKKNIVAVDLKERKKIGHLELKESVVFSNDLRNWMLEENDVVSKYTIE